MLKYSSGSRDAAAAISGVDQHLRECLQSLRLALPRELSDVDKLESEFRRLVERAIEDFREDLVHFPPDRYR